MNYLNDIVDVAITIENPVASTESYSNMLIVAPEGTGSADTKMPDALQVNSLDDLTFYGYSTTDPAYAAVAVAQAQTPEPNIIYVTAMGKDETIADCLARANAAGAWYGFTLAGIDTENYEAAADWAEANHKLFAFNFTTDECPINMTGRDYAFGMYSGSTGDETESNANKYQATGFMAKCFGNMPGSQTWEYKTITGASPSKLTDAQVRSFQKIPVLYYVRVAGRNITMNSKVGSGEWIDIIRLRDYLVTEIQERVFTTLVNAKKVPYNDEGIAAIQGAVTNVLIAAQNNGAIDADAYQDDGTVVRGYTVSVPLAMNIPKSDKKERRLRNVNFTARLAGAIHNVKIRGTLVYGGTD